MMHRAVFCLMIAAWLAAPVQADIAPLGCRANGAITIVAIGDIIFQPPSAAVAHFSYRNAGRSGANVIAKADLAYANIEGPIAATLSTQMSPPSQLSFNYRASLITELKTSGFDVV